jgi:hypothetical protein
MTLYEYMILFIIVQVNNHHESVSLSSSIHDASSVWLRCFKAFIIIIMA